MSILGNFSGTVHTFHMPLASPGLLSYACVVHNITIYLVNIFLSWQFVAETAEKGINKIFMQTKNGGMKKR